MICTDCDCYRNETGKWTLSFTVKGDSIHEAQRTADELRGKDIDVTARKHSGHRSTNANAYFHSLINHIASKLGTDMTTVKRTLVRSYGAMGEDGNGEPAIVSVPKGVDIYQYYDYAVWIGGDSERDEYAMMKQTHKMTVDEFKVLLDATIQEAKELGIETMSPSELEVLYASYDKGLPNTAGN